MDKVLVVTGLPRSGTTFCGDMVANAYDKLWDELDPSRLIFFNQNYYEHLINRSRLTREFSRNEGHDRFEKIRERVELDTPKFEDVWRSVIDGSVVIKYPLIFDEVNMIPFLKGLESVGIVVQVLLIRRDLGEVVLSMQSRNMYFSNSIVGRVYVKMMLRRYMRFFDECGRRGLKVFEFDKSNPPAGIDDLLPFVNEDSCLEDYPLELLKASRFEFFLKRLIYKAKHLLRKKVWR